MRAFRKNLCGFCHFKKDGIEVLDEAFLKTKAYLQRELEAIDNDKMTMLDEDDFWESTEGLINS